MSSMRNAVQRRNHKERAQPRDREKWGILEKHKDYSLRAKDYNEKKARLKILRQKAADRNPDEFYYGMLSSESSQGRKVVDRGNRSLSHDTVKLLKTQDAAYLQNAIRRTSRAIDKLQEGLVLEDDQIETLGTVSGGDTTYQHTLFAEGQQEQRELSSQRGYTASDSRHEFNRDVEKSNEADPNGLSFTNKSQRRLEREKATVREARNMQKKHRKEQNARRISLERLRAREKDLRDAEHELELQRAKMSSSVGGINKNGTKWRIRQRRS